MRINWDVIRHMSGSFAENERDFLNELLLVFQESLPRKIFLLRESIEKNDSQDFLRATHAIRSSSAFLGGIGIERICEELDAALAFPTEKKRQLCDLLEVEFYETIRDLQRGP